MYRDVEPEVRACGWGDRRSNIEGLPWWGKDRNV